MSDLVGNLEDRFSHNEPQMEETLMKWDPITLFDEARQLIRSFIDNVASVLAILVKYLLQNSL